MRYHVAKKDKTVQDDIKREVIGKHQLITSDMYDAIDTFMRTTDEVLLLKKVKLLNRNSNKTTTQKRSANETASKPKRQCIEETINESTPIANKDDTKQEKKSTKTFSTAAKVVLSSVKMKQASKQQNNETAKLMNQKVTEQSLLATCGDAFNSKVR